MGGLQGEIGTTATDGSAGDVHTMGVPNYTATDAGSPGAGGGGSTSEDPLDPLFEGSNWTRQDAELALALLNSAIFVAWLYMDQYA